MCCSTCNDGIRSLTLALPGGGERVAGVDTARYTKRRRTAHKLKTVFLIHINPKPWAESDTLIEQGARARDSLSH